MPVPVIEHLVTIDFETFYDKDFTLKKLSTEAYIRDPRFEGIGVGVDDGDGERAWMEVDEFRGWARGVDWSKVGVLAHHAHFDGAIASWHFGVKPALWFCTLSMGRALHGTEVGGSLAKLAAHYGVGEKGTEVEDARGKRRADFTREEWLRYGDYCLNDTKLTRGIFDKMMERGFPDSELLLIDTTIRMFTEPKFVLDVPLVERIIIDEQRRKAELLERVSQDKSVLMSNDKFAALLVENGIEPPTKISPRTGQETWAFAKSDPGMKELLEHEDEQIRWLAEARVGVKSTINETRAQRFLATQQRGGNIPVYIRYYAAHTGRFGGADRMNMQNLERTNKKNPQRGLLRKALRAPPGKKVVVADSGQIEARVTAWLAGNAGLLDAFAKKRDVYCEFATEVYRRPITKADEIERHVGKASVLGLGFGMGWHKFAMELMRGAQGGPPVVFTEKEAEAMGINVQRFLNDEKKMERVEAMPSRVPFEQRAVHSAVSEAVVYKYRNINADTVNLWKLMEEMLVKMLGEEEVHFGPGGLLHTVRHGIMLPNGLVLRYPGLRRGEDGEGFSYMGGKGGKERVKAYGGSMTENVVQALARIIVTEQLVTARFEHGMEIITMTHDENVILEDEARAAQTSAMLLKVMHTPPKWAPDLPLSAEGGFADVYGEAK